MHHLLGYKTHSESSLQREVLWRLYLSSPSKNTGKVSCKFFILSRFSRIKHVDNNRKQFCRVGEVEIFTTSRTTLGLILGFVVF